MKEFLFNNWQAIAGILGGISLWFGGRKHLLKSQVQQSQAEVTGANIDNVTATLDVYKSALDDLELRYKKRMLELQEDLEIMKTQSEDLKKVIAGNEKYIKKLRMKLDEYEGYIKTLEEKVQSYENMEK